MRFLLWLLKRLWGNRPKHPALARQQTYERRQADQKRELERIRDQIRAGFGRER